MHLVAKLDERRAGLAGHFIRASHERRQVISTYLACVDHTKIEDGMLEKLCHAGHREILSQAFKEVPRGLRGALKRSEKKSHPREFYRSLIRLLSAMPPYERKQFSYLEGLNDDLLDRWGKCPVRWRRAKFVSVFYSSKELADFTIATEALLDHGISSSQLDSKINMVTERSQLASLISGVVSKLSFPTPPIEGSVFGMPVRSVSELRTIASEFRNCAAGYVYDVLSGRSYFYVVRDERRKAIVHLELESGQWILTELFGISNRAVDREFADHISLFFEERGITVAATSRPSPWDLVQSFSRPSIPRRR